MDEIDNNENKIVENVKINYEKGVAPIRKEFLIKNLKQEDLKNEGLKNDQQQNDENNKRKINENGDDKDEKNRKKQRGQNKQRRNKMHKEVKKLGKFNNDHGICRVYFRENQCPFGDVCIYSHDIDKYYRENPERNDINDRCPNFEKFGKCNAGIFCCFGQKHLLDNRYNIIDWEKFEKISKEDYVTNFIDKNLQIKLRKRQYFTEDNLKEIKMINLKFQSNDDNCIEKLKLEKRFTPLKKPIDFRGKLYLAPLTTVGNLPFRRICKEFGADITCGEMALCQSLMDGSNSEWALIRRHSSEDLFGVQICGTNAEQIACCAKILANECSIDFIDLNMGCPIDLIYRKGAGCALMERRRKIENIIYTVSSVINIPFTIKMRTGVHIGKNIAKNLIQQLRQWNNVDERLSLVTIHGRTREQRYTKLADWPYIKECADEAHCDNCNSYEKKLQLFGSGDILSYEDYLDKLNNYNVDGCMIGRGALIKPWIFTEIKERRLWDIRSTERLDILRRFVDYGLSNWGSDREGVEKTRWFLLEWLSFLHRYIPIGLLEFCQPHYSINDRPPRYFGRDDLETLMSSSSCIDWIKISEMLLGRVDDGFTFIPKHKASSY